MNARDKRAAVAAALRLAVPEGWTVYDSTFGIAMMPCAAIAPQSPYRTVSTAGSDEVHLRVSLTLPVAGGQLAIDTLDDLLDDIDTALANAGDIEVQWESVSDLAIVTNEAGAEYLAARLNITVI